MNNEWKRNRGRKSLPVPAGTLVDVVHRGGAVHKGVKCGTGGRYAENWEIDGSNGDIVKWRLHEEPAVHDTPPEQGWIEWGGGDRPVGANQKVEVRLRCGEQFTKLADGLRWAHHAGVSQRDIIAYRLIFPASAPPPPPTAPTIDQLIQSWRELTDRAAAAQAEADALTAQVNQAADAVAAALTGAGWGQTAIILDVDEPDMTDCRNWQVGDIVEYLGTGNSGILQSGKHYPILRMGDTIAELDVRANWQPFSSLRWISRPTQP